MPGRQDESPPALEMTENPYATVDALPAQRNYRTNTVASSRPSMQDLHSPDGSAPIWPTLNPLEEIELEAKQNEHKLGWINGVLVKCLLNIWGLIMFLRLPKIVSECGLIGALLMIFTAALITTTTTLSLCGLVTNGVIGGGGLYFVISRSLGLRTGTTTGLLYGLTMMIGAAMYLMGFAESFQGVFTQIFETSLVDGGIMDQKIFSVIALFLLTGLGLRGLNGVKKLDLVLMLLLITAQVLIITGCIMGPQSTEDLARGFVGLNMAVLRQNAYPDFRTGRFKVLAAFQLFGLFFPSMTGFSSGVNISGDLKKPSSAIPKGTLIAITISGMSYFLHAVLLAASNTRDASGNVEEMELFLNSTGYLNGTLHILDSPTFTQCPTPSNGLVGPPCKYGLANSNSVMGRMSIFQPIVDVGCMAASISSALASLTASPRILQAMGNDGIFGKFMLFARVLPNGEPIYGQLISALVTLVFIMIDDLEVVAGFLTSCFLGTYLAVNFSCLVYMQVSSPAWRPSFQFVNIWTCIVGGVGCLIAMFAINYVTALVILLCIAILHFILGELGITNNGGTCTTDAIFNGALRNTLALQPVTPHVKNFRPQIMVLSGMPECRPSLMDLAAIFTKKQSLLCATNVLTNQTISWKAREEMKQKMAAWLSHYKIEAFPYITQSPSLTDAVTNMTELMGVGWLKPNMIMMGYKNDWMVCDREEMMDHFNIVNAAFSMRVGMSYLRMPNGLDYSDTYLSNISVTTPEQSSDSDATTPEQSSDSDATTTEQSSDSDATTPEQSSDSDATTPEQSSDSDASMDSVSVEGTPSSELTPSEVSLPEPPSTEASEISSEEAGSTISSASIQLKHRTSYRTLSMNYVRKIGEREGSPLSNSDVNRIKKERRQIVRKIENEHQKLHNTSSFGMSDDLVDEMSYFRRGHGKGTIDVWWLYDDGGLNLILAHILSQRNRWRECLIRVFVLGLDSNNGEEERKNMVRLLKDLRIEVPKSEVRVINALEPTAPQNLAHFLELIEPFRGDGQDGCTINDEKLEEFKGKTNRNLNIRQNLLKHSMDANLIIMNLPMLRQGAVPAALYLAWLEILSKGMPPFLFVRGNQTNVITAHA